MITKTRDLVDEMFDSLDLVDQVELDPEEKVIYSKEMTKILREEISKAIGKLPIGQMIGSVIEKQVNRALKENERTSSDAIAALERRLKDSVGWTKDEMKRELEKLEKKLKEKYADLRNNLSSQSYTFGGFPQFGSAQEGKFLKISSGTPTWATGGGGGSSLAGFTVTHGDGTLSFDATDVSVDILAQIVATMISQLQP